ncbi:hypothetical protein BJ944DRAFT_168905 [Cunninghamella echinulata]|nr:hypothetical protein BJ944DRAFT_168905 [Cunninghamella echinulata]
MTLYEDIQQVEKAMNCFYDSRIQEAETLLSNKNGIYVSLGKAFILFLKSMMTFQETDIKSTHEALKETIQLAGQLRKKEGWMNSFSSLWQQRNPITHLQSLTIIEKHAELIYAEAYLLKAILSIIHDESILSFVREGLNIRNSYNTYIMLEKYIAFVQQEAAKGKDVKKYELDDHFTSGVCLGIGCFNIILSMLPSSVIKVVEFIGFTVNRAHGLETLVSAGDWYHDQNNHHQDHQPTNALRRPLCDMVLMLYNIILANYVPLSHVNSDLTTRIMDYNLKQYPSGIFFLYFEGRRLVGQGKLDQAIEIYHQAIETQKDWQQFCHLCYWDLGIIALIQKKWNTSLDIYEKLYDESNWSKSVYQYLMAISLYQQAMECDVEEKKVILLSKVHDLIEKVPTSKKKVAGKSIPMEKFVSRKSNSYLRDGFLILPDLEILNIFTAFEWMPQDILCDNLDLIDKQLKTLDSSTTKNYEDDLCLLNYLKAVTSRCLIVAQKQQVEKANYTLDDLKKIHSVSLDNVFDHAKNVLWDHYIYYFGHYEKGRFLVLDSQWKEAETELNIVIKANDRGYYNVGAGSHAKSKYSMANALQFKCHNCVLLIHQLEGEEEIEKEDIN